MIEGKTSSGFQFKLDESFMDDFLFLRAFKMANSSDAEAQVDGAVDLVRILFNDPDEEERFYKHLGGLYNGRVPADVVGKEIGEIIDIAENHDEDAKN